MALGKRPYRAENDVVLLTGAGASAFLGLRTLDSVLRQMDTQMHDNEVVDLLNRTRLAIEGNLNRISHAVFEELIARLKYYLQVTDTLLRDPTFHNEVGSLPHAVHTGTLDRKWKAALTACYRILISEYGPQKIQVAAPEFATTITLLRELAALNEQELHIYTTNYDCSYQVLAANSDVISLWSHIDNSSGIFKESWYPSRSDVTSKAPRMFVHRLHGCVAWFSQADPHGVSEIYGAGSNLTIDDDDMLHRMCIKLITSQEIGTNLAFLSAYEEFYEHMQRAACLIIWGSSFRDMEVLRAINSVYATRRELLRILYINPFRSEEMVVNSIRRTLRPVPVVLADSFRPRQIPWLPQQRGEDLVAAVLKCVSNATTQCKPRDEESNNEKP